MASTWYADSAVSSSGDGTSWAQAKKTLVEAAALVGNGDTLNLRGTFRAPDYLTIANKTGVTVQGDGTCWVRGDRVVTGSWTDVGSGCWSKNIGAGLTVGLTILGVVEDWDTRVDGQGRHYGHLVAAAAFTDVQAADGRWAYDATSGDLFISPSDGSNPNSNGKVYAWCWSADNESTGGNAVLLDTCVSCTVKVLTTALTMRMDGAQGYGVRLANCTGCVVEDVTVWDYGYHGVGAAKNYAASCTFRRCTAWGGFSDGTQIVNPFVFASTIDTTGLGGNCVGEDLVWYAYPNLRYDGAVNVDWPATGVLFLQSHGGPNAGYTNRGVMEGISWKRCRVYDKHPGTSPCGIGYVTAKHSRQPTDRTDPSTYKIIVEDGYAQVRGPQCRGPIAFKRCTFDALTTTSILGASAGLFYSDGDYTTVNGWEICEDGGGQTTGNQYFGSCAIAANMAGASNSCILRIESGPDGSHPSRVTLRGCTLFAGGAIASAGTTFGKLLSASTSFVDAKGCIFSRENTGTGANLWQGATSTPSTCFIIADCWYYNIDAANRYCQNGSGSPLCAAVADYTANVDPAGVYATNPQLNAPTSADLSLLAGGAAMTTTKVLTGMPASGVNGAPYDGHYGAYQYGVLGGGLHIGIGIKIS